MKKKTLASIFAFTAVATTVGTGVMSQSAVAKDNSNSNEVLLAQNDGNSNGQNNSQTTNSNQATATTQSTENSQVTGTAVVINGDGSLVLMGSNTVKSNLVGYLSAGEMMTVQGEDSGWYKVTVQETGESGYIKATNLQFIESGVNDPLSVLKGNGTVINVSSNLRIRSAATMDSSTVGHLLNGNSFKILGKEGQWYKISANGVTGFVYSDYVAPSIINAVSSNGSNGTATSSATVANNENNTTSNVKTNTMSKVTVDNSQAKDVSTSNGTSTTKSSSSESVVASATSNSTTKVTSNGSSATATSNSSAKATSDNGSATATSSSNAKVTSDNGSATATSSSSAKATSNSNKATASASSAATAVSSGSNSGVTNSSAGNKAAVNNTNLNATNSSNSKLYNDIYNIVKANFWTNPNTEGSTMSMNMSQTYAKDGVNYYSVYVHTTNSDNGSANTAHYYISANGNILNGDSFTNTNNDSNNKLTTSQIKEAVSQVASEYLNGQVNSGSLVYNISMNNSTVNNGTTYYAVEVYNGSINSNNYISTIYVSPNGQVEGTLPQSEGNNNTVKKTQNTQNHQITKRTRSTADVVNTAS